MSKVFPVRFTVRRRILCNVWVNSDVKNETEHFSVLRRKFSVLCYSMKNGIPVTVMRRKSNLKRDGHRNVPTETRSYKVDTQ